MTEVSLASLTPASVAVIGASDNHNKVGGRPIHYMRKFGFAGKIFPVNYTATGNWWHAVSVVFGKKRSCPASMPSTHMQAKLFPSQRQTLS